MILKKLYRILCVILEPVSSVSQAKTVTPRIHIPHEASTPDALNVISQNDLQITNGRFLKVISARVTIQTHAPVCRHTDDMTGFMEH